MQRVEIRQSKDGQAVDVITEQTQKVRYTPEELEKRIAGLTQSIAKFQEQKEYYENIQANLE